MNRGDDDRARNETAHGRTQPQREANHADPSGRGGIEAAKIAAAFKGMSVMDYASRILLEQANRDIEEGYRNRMGSASSPEEARPRHRKSRGEGSEK